MPNPKHLQEKTTVIQRIPPRWDSTNHSYRNHRLGHNHSEQPSVVLTHKSDFLESKTILLALFARICRDISNTDTRKLLYCSIVRPKLESAREICSPYTCKDKVLLENVQRRATKLILNYPKDISYKDRLLKLDLLPLENGRDLKDLVLIFKAKAGHVDLGHHDFFRQTEIHHRTRNACKYNYHIPYANQNYLKHSF